ncbi:integrase family protein [Methanofollis liminatans DSM 4140]|uniref:Integrase family protein n=1 Tax=Methanofollis liminatans DSM 4140 TaxID=28892 RepID=J0RYM0_9EURY|nr:tyrosine-type recombinase/integrase [Methanofollis liminatans]EJG06651.1 integrase family protein [Methanofollis liminatans DSM 4140]
MARGVRSGSAFHRTDATYTRQGTEMIEKAVVEGRITRDDADLITLFLAELSAAGRGICASRRYKITVHACALRRWLPPFREATYADLLRAVESVKTATKANGEPYAKNTIADIVRILRRLFMWMGEEGFTEIPAEKIRRKIRPPPYQRVTKGVDDVLTEDEIRRSIEACRTTKDRALISVLYESGMRIGELAALRWRDIEFNDWNAALSTDGKTGILRYIPLILARGDLAMWRGQYPGDPRGDALVFLTEHTHQPLQYAGVVKQIKAITVRARIEKKITPHLFRHSRITHLVQQGVSESVIKLMMWGNLRTDMLETYLHLRKDDISKAMATLNGVETPDTSDAVSPLEPKQCPRCKRIWPPDAGWCMACGLELTEAAADEKARLKAEAIEFVELATEHPDLMREVLDEMRSRRATSVVK